MDKMSALRSCQLFVGLPEYNIEELDSIAYPRSFSKEEIIFADGEEGEGFYVVIDGRVKIYKIGADGREQILHFVSDGDPFAEITLFADTAYPAFAKAVTNVQTLFFRRDDFKALVCKDPQLSLNMIAILSRHLRRFAVLVEELSLKDVPARVARYLLNLTPRDGWGGEGGIQVELDTSKTELAQRLGTISETISRTLGKMKASGLIDIDGKKITILDEEMLEELAEGVRK